MSLLTVRSINGRVTSLLEPMWSVTPLLVGTSGYGYNEWKGSFYPPRFSRIRMLSYYADRLPTVEINRTFHAMPSEKTVASWADQTPDGFRFVLKAPEVITHKRRLKGVEEEIDQFLRVASVLDGKLGSLLFQFPPGFEKDLSRLEALLDLIDGRAPSAFEFRHPSWHDDDVFDCLRAHSCAWCIADTDDAPIRELMSTADWGYLRLRRKDYSDAELAEWAKWLKAQNWREAYVFFKHEETGTGPKFAARLLDLLKQ